MAKPHKLAGARIEVDTVLPADRTIDVARQAVATQRALKIVGDGGSTLRVQVNQGLISAPVMTFTVSVDSVGGRSRAVSSIEEYRTSQTTVNFIPVGPKSMEGIGVYRRFMVSFGQAMQAADPSAQVRMIERDLPGGAGPVSGYAPEGAAPILPVPLPPGHDPTIVPQAPEQGMPSQNAQPAAPSAQDPPGWMPEPAGYAPAGSAPAPGPAFAASDPVHPVPNPAPAAPLLSESNARIVQIVGGVIVILGLIFWYATPSNVTVGPLLVILLGAVIAGVGFFIGRNAGRAAADELAAKLRHERSLHQAGSPGAQPAVPLPPSAAPVLPSVAESAPLATAVAPVSTPVIPPVPLPPASLAESPAPVTLPPAPGAETPPLPPVVGAPPMPAAPAPAPAAPAPAAPAPAGPISSIPGLPVRDEVAAPAVPVMPAAPLAPAVPVLPAAPVAAATPSATGESAASDDDDDLDATRIASARTGIEWQLVLPDGRRIAVASALRLGRDPIADPALPGTVLVPIDDPAKSLSKTHAQLEAGPGVLVVTDLHSTNGTVVRAADGAEVVLSPGTGHQVIGDAELRLGDYTVRLHRFAMSGGH